jgi:hypothetical protein
MATQVRETSAGKSISAYIVLNKKREHVATVNVHYSNGGTVTADVWNHGDKPVNACLDAAIRAGVVTEARLEKAIDASEAKRSWIGESSDRHTDWAAYDLFGLQQGRAGGYGHDKVAAALAGLWIDGQQLSNHCGTVANAQKAKDALMRKYVKWAMETEGKHGTQKDWDVMAQKIGARFANWSTDRNAFRSLHFIAALPRLESLGYTIIQAL